MKKIGSDEYVSARVNAWCKNHGKVYLTDEADLMYFIQRYNKHVGRAKLIAHILTSTTLILLGGWMYIRTDLNTENILATLTLSLVVWIVTRVFLGDAGKNRELFDSLRKLNREWERLEELHNTAEDDSYHLRKIGMEISEAERRRDESTKTKLIKQFRWDHKVLFNFGIVEEDWGKYIPKPQTILKTGNGDRIGL